MCVVLIIEDMRNAPNSKMVYGINGRGDFLVASGDKNMADYVPFEDARILRAIPPAEAELVWMRAINTPTKTPDHVH